MENQGTYQVKPRWGYLLALPLSMYAGVSFMGRYGGSVEPVLALAKFAGTVLGILAAVGWPTYKALKRHPACADVAEVVVGQGGVRVILDDGREINISRVEGARIRRSLFRQSYVAGNKLVFEGTLPDQSRIQRTVFRQNLSGKTWVALVRDVGKAMSPAASGKGS